MYPLNSNTFLQQTISQKECQTIMTFMDSLPFHFLNLLHFLLPLLSVFPQLSDIPSISCMLFSCKIKS